MKWLFVTAVFLPSMAVYAFGDIASDDPQLPMLQHLNDVKIMTAYPDGNFHPEKIVTRAEALAISLRAGGIQIPAESVGKTYFTDVDPNEWYAPFTVRGVDTQVVAGPEQNPNFRPNEAITKAEFLAFLFRATGVKFGNYMHKTRDISLDVSESDWFAPYFAYAKRFQIAHLPPDGFYRPNKLLSRQEVGVMTYRQLRIFYGDNTTKLFVELQAEIEQFITLLRAGEPEQAEMHLQRIVELNDALAHTNNNQDAIAASAISKALEHFSDSLRAFKFGQNLTALENLHLAAKQTSRAMEKSEKLAPFARDLGTLIDETLMSFVHPQFDRFSQK